MRAEDKPLDFAEIARKSPNYQIGAIRALEIVQADPGWLRRDIVYAEAHSISVALDGIWIDAMTAPLPDHLAALIEFTPSRRGAAEGFWVRLIRLQNLPIHRPADRPAER